MADGGNIKPKVYPDLAAILLETANIFQPPERLTVSSAAAKYRYLNNAPVYIGPWKNETTPYMVEPQDVFTSLHYTSEVFVGPAQSAKTDGLILNTLLYTIICDPVDMILYQISQAVARDFSKRRVDRMHRHSKAAGAQLISGRHNDNVFDKNYKSGMMFTLSWPSVNEMSGKPVPRVLLTDYDRMPTDVDGEGSPFDLAKKRATTFRSFGMTVAESSPGREITDAKWKPSPNAPHEAPPCEGILSLYNRGDRRRWYWPCPHCGEFFEGNFSMLQYDDMGDISKTARTVWMKCPHNGCRIEQEQRYDMNLRGVWLREGESITKGGVRGGDPTVSDMASFWLKGVAATFVTWYTLVVNYLNAMAEYKRTGSEDSLRTTVNTDQGEPYLPKAMEETREPEDLKNQAIPLPEKEVPVDTRALIATLDTQKNRWEVQVHGISPGAPFDVVVIDRFPVYKSHRKDNDGERLWVKPAAYPEDWDVLIEEVIQRRYPLEDGSGDMGIAYAFCDSGGKSGTTTNAYDFYRRLKKKGIHDRFFLTKGDPNPNVPRAHLSYPDTNRKDRFANARGEIPVLFLNSNSLKDTLNGLLERSEDGGGRIWFPDWLGQPVEKGGSEFTEKFFDELTVEIRTAKGWENPHKRRNESWDLLYMLLGACVFRQVDRTDWLNPPKWLDEWDNNPLVTRRRKPGEAPVAGGEKTQYGLGDLGKLLG